MPWSFVTNSALKAFEMNKHFQKWAPDKIPDVDHFCRRAGWEQATHRPRDAKQTYYEGLDVYPDNVDLLLGLAKLLENHYPQRADKAVYFYKRAVLLKPDDPKVITQAADFLTNHDRADYAERLLAHLYLKSEDKLISLIGLTKHYLDRSDFINSYASLGKAVTLPNAPDTLKRHFNTATNAYKTTFDLGNWQILETRLIRIGEDVPGTRQKVPKPDCTKS